jgi:hypothetical protein
MTEQAAEDDGSANTYHGYFQGSLNVPGMVDVSGAVGAHKILWTSLIGYVLNSTLLQLLGLVLKG